MEETLPGLLTAHAERTPRGVALRQKRLGIWQEVTWAEYLAGAQAISLGLVGLGLKPGEVVALAGESRVPWLEAELGVQAAGGVAAPLSAHATHSVLADLLCTCGARFVIVEGQEQVDQLLSIRGEIPSVERVIYWDLRGMRAYSDAWLLPLWELTGQQPPADRQAASPASFQKGTVDAGARDRFMTMLTALRSEAAAEVVFTPAPTEHRGAYASATPT